MLSIAAAILLSGPLGVVTSIPAQTPQDMPRIRVNTIGKPSILSANGETLLFYELELRSQEEATFNVLGLDVSSEPTGGKPIVTYSGAQLLGLIGRYSNKPMAPAATVERGTLTVLFLCLTFGAKAEVPARLHHTLRLESQGKKQELRFTVDVDRTDPATIGPPLQGGDWFAANALQNNSGHRRALLRRSDSESVLAQRFAIDWLKFGPDGMAFKGDPKVNANWYGYGSPLIAVADGTVVATKDGMPDNTPFTTMSGSMSLDTIGGNFVSLNIGGGRYAFYGHLQPQSLRVKVGDKVKRGQPLGLLGNSGNSDAPHLHFHIADARSGLDADGLPYAFSRFEQVGNIAPGDFLRAGKVQPLAEPKPVVGEMPGFPGVYRFP